MKSDDPLSEIRRFQQYVSYWITGHPRFTDKEPESRVPWPWIYASILMSEYGRTEAQAWSTLASDAMWMCAAYAIWTGNKEYVTLDQFSCMEIMKEQDDG